MVYLSADIHPSKQLPNMADSDYVDRDWHVTTELCSAIVILIVILLLLLLLLLLLQCCLCVVYSEGTSSSNSLTTDATAAEGDEPSWSSWTRVRRQVMDMIQTVIQQPTTAPITDQVYSQPHLHHNTDQVYS